jgi:hypothetical protein
MAANPEMPTPKPSFMYILSNSGSIDLLAYPYKTSRKLTLEGDLGFLIYIALQLTGLQKTARLI